MLESPNICKKKIKSWGFKDVKNDFPMRQSHSTRSQPILQLQVSIMQKSSFTKCDTSNTPKMQIKPRLKGFHIASLSRYNRDMTVWSWNSWEIDHLPLQFLFNWIDPSPEIHGVQQQCNLKWIFAPCCRWSSSPYFSGRVWGSFTSPSPICPAGTGQQR